MAGRSRNPHWSLSQVQRRSRRGLTSVACHPGLKATNAVWLPWNTIFIAAYEGSKRAAASAACSPAPGGGSGVAAAADEEGMQSAPSSCGSGTSSTAEELSPFVLGICSAGSASLAGILTHPADVVKTRLQVLSACQAHARATAWSLACQMWRTEGLKVFLTGLGARILQLAPAACSKQDPSDDTSSGPDSHASGHARLPTSIVTRRSEDTQASRLAKSLSTAYLLNASSTQAADVAVSNSDGGVPSGAATVATSSGMAGAWLDQGRGRKQPAAHLRIVQLQLFSCCALARTGYVRQGYFSGVWAVPAVGSRRHANMVNVAAASLALAGGGPTPSGGRLALTGSHRNGPSRCRHYPRMHASHSVGSGDEPLQTLAAYVLAEAQPAEKTPTADVVWGQTERERVYNFLLYVPYQLERLIWFGSLLLVDSFLGVFTLLPLRCALAMAQLAFGAATGATPLRRTRDPRGAAAAEAADNNNVTPGPGPDRRLPRISFADATSGTTSVSESSTAAASFRGAPSFNGGVAAAAAAAVAAVDGRSRGGGTAAPRLSGSQLYDMVCLAILFLATAALRAILSNFGNDVLEALSGTCTQWLAGKKRLWELASDALVACIIVTLHALTLMCQALIVAVALNSSRNGLVALLIANNFVEIKSTVFKKWDSTRIWALVCADAVERFHLLVVLSFVVVEEMDSAGSWLPPHDYLRVCVLMVAAEVVIDIIKHAVLGKFNEVRPGLYREFHQELCAKALAAQSHSAPRLLNFHHLAPAALAMRIAVTLFWLRVETRAQMWPRLFIVAALYGILCGVKLLFGYCIKVLAHYHSRYYNRKFGVKAYGARPAPASRAAAGTVTGHPMGTPATGTGLGWGPVASAPLPHPTAPTGPSTLSLTVPSHPGLTAGTPQQPLSPALAAAPAAAPAPYGPGQGSSGNSYQLPSVELTAAVNTAAHGGSRGPVSPLALVGAVPRRLSGPAPGVAPGTAGGSGPGLATTLLSTLSGLGAGSGHAKVD
ncbi:hypothetical protein VOLCADRAFT_86592 [Volvox carteri f. nagariensis]|uniref:Uncharacterized protein n=1 Tax=Volvox carteri f. nagariensis TaxID=3068 RepID=D8TJ30_VOLCA|nr:uncharacterized protein VOLCADRAFT_86592 [Volvox carteri f. nagariensis]EFJ52305.1 hypothetical protein VOLCADRAFT_86592 [Volvox carteri f. nagariensis]|eukprot:XP_002946378.1 hypothetical protein VOLCADRAFT_86592 [Volvox carteri f. nagariensis]